MNHLGKEVLVDVDNKRYRLSRFTRKLLGQFLNWSDTVLPNPLDCIRDKLAGFSPDLQEIMVREAISSARLRKSVNSPEVQALMARPEGMMKIISLLFQQYHPELSDAEVEVIFDRCQELHGDTYLADKIAEATGRFEHPTQPAEEPGQKKEDSQSQRSGYESMAF